MPHEIAPSAPGMVVCAPATLQPLRERGGAALAGAAGAPALGGSGVASSGGEPPAPEGAGSGGVGALVAASDSVDASLAPASARSAGHGEVNRHASNSARTSGSGLSLPEVGMRRD